MPFNPNDIDQLNSDIKGWNDRKDQQVLNEMSALNIKHSKFSPNRIPLRRAYKTTLRKRNGLTDRISHSIPRSGILLHKGVSRAHPKTNPREVKDWFNSVVDKNLDELGDIVSDGQGTMIINAVTIK